MSENALADIIRTDLVRASDAMTSKRLEQLDYESKARRLQIEYDDLREKIKHLWAVWQFYGGVGDPFTKDRG